MPHCILIVDDNSDVRLSLRRLFESMSGWEVCGEAINGRDGIEKAQLLNPDLVVLDLSMPEMDGIATAKVLNSIFPALPIIMFTNFAEDQFLEREVLSAGNPSCNAFTDVSDVVTRVPAHILRSFPYS